MSGTIQIAQILRIFVVVADVQAAVEAYRSSGIGPWEFQDFSDTAVPEKFVGDKSAAYQMKLATCDALNVGLGLIEPLDDISIFATHLRKHGPGVHHLLVATTDGFEASIAAVPAMQHGRTATGIRYAHLDQRDPLGLVLEVFDLPPASA